MYPSQNCEPCHPECPEVVVPAPPACVGEPCVEITPGQCVRYTGVAIPCLNIANGENLNSIITKMSTILCDVNILDGTLYTYVHADGTPTENAQRFLEKLAVAKSKIVNPTITLPTLAITTSVVDDEDDGYFITAPIPVNLLQPYYDEELLNTAIMVIGVDEYPGFFYIDDDDLLRFESEGESLPNVGTYSNVKFYGFDENEVYIKRSTLILGNGHYEFQNTIQVNAEYLNIVALTDSEVVFTFKSATPSTEITTGINITRNNIVIKGITVKNNNIKINSFENEKIRLENCIAGDDSYSSDNEYNIYSTFINCKGGLRSFGYYSNCLGIFIDCTAKAESFGYNGDCGGYFLRCFGGDSSFGYSGHCDGVFINCQNDSYVFDEYGETTEFYAGGLFGSEGTCWGTFTNCGGNFISSSFGSYGTANGTFINCHANYQSFGSNGQANGKFLNCSGQWQRNFGYNGQASGIFINCHVSTESSIFYNSESFGSGPTGEASGTFIDCTALGRYNFGCSYETQNGVASGYFKNCIAAATSFGDFASGTFINCVCEQAQGGQFIHPTPSFGGKGFSGIAYNCIGSPWSFGGFGTLTGKLYWCKSGTTFPIVSSGGRTRQCIDGNDNLNNQG
jgi:hypothetical protein